MGATNMAERITEGELLHSLSRLEGLLKGGPAPDGEDMEKAQILQGKGSSGGRLDHMAPEKYGDSWDDGISSGGTDYNGRGGKARKAQEDEGDMPYSRKQGRAEAEEEGMEAAPEGEEEAEPEGQDEESEEKSKKAIPNPPSITRPGGGGVRRSMAKSQEFATEEENVRKGVEVSEFLYYLRKSINDTFSDMERRLRAQIEVQHDERGEFAKSLAEGVVGIRSRLEKSVTTVEEEENAPAHAPKSITKGIEASASDVNKSLEDVRVQRQQTLDSLVDMLQKGQVQPLDVTKFELYGELRPEIAKSLQNHT